MLSESTSIPNEFYLGDLPGTLQYTKSIEEISDLVLPESLSGKDETNGFEMSIYTDSTHEEDLLRSTPNTKTGTKNEWTLILCMKLVKIDDSCEIWLKSALLNKKTNKIALMTSTNNILNITSRGHRAIQSCFQDWFIGHYRMSAPLLFWRVLQTRLKTI